MINLSALRAALLACSFSVAMAGAANAEQDGARNGLGRAQITRENVSGDPRGAGNTGVVVQTGEGNTALLRQAGSGNNGSITQTGDNNSACLFQLGRRLNGSISQIGDNQSVALVQTRAGMHPVPMQVCASQMGGRVRGHGRVNVRMTAAALR